MRYLLLASAALANTPAYTQSTPAEPAETPPVVGAPAETGDDIVVAARRREDPEALLKESLKQKIPIFVTWA